MSPLAPLLLRGDCLVELKRIPDESVDAVVTDPPYGLGFMGKGWDIHTPLDFERFCEAWAAECLRILKPGGHLLAFGGSRTWHRLAAGIEDAGFEIRDSIAWLYGSGFPKSMDVSKAIDKAAGATREVVGKHPAPTGNKAGGASYMMSVTGMPESADLTAPATDAAREWEGWGTALKPGFEPVVVARKPLAGTVAANVLEYGTGALNIDASRIGTETRELGGFGDVRGRSESIGGFDGYREKKQVEGRWPANVILDESQAAALDASTKPTNAGGVSRFFYVAKAPKSERPVVEGVAHPTVKPLAIMRYLLRLVTPPGGVIVDPFAGSGATLEAAYLEGFESIGVEMTSDYWPLIEARIERVTS